MGEGGGKKKRIGWGWVREGQRKANGGAKQQRNVKRIVWEISREMPKVGQKTPVKEGVCAHSSKRLKALTSQGLCMWLDSDPSVDWASPPISLRQVSSSK